eukprot:gnl/Chilomastix_cuspidata/1599.p1 GENE.gnl/Chilomastix_cuspidata/1599~~gnl/Chilomastix_cuspidata/1599.p1  ORF type:complete len:458 (-),score=132.84 gnl/Chilomastix_cuspidata/1599:42-1367(-)
MSSDAYRRSCYTEIVGGDNIGESLKGLLRTIVEAFSFEYTILCGLFVQVFDLLSSGFGIFSEGLLVFFSFKRSSSVPHSLYHLLLLTAVVFAAVLINLLGVDALLDAVKALKFLKVAPVVELTKLLADLLQFHLVAAAAGVHKACHALAFIWEPAPPDAKAAHHARRNKKKANQPPKAAQVWRVLLFLVWKLLAVAVLVFFVAAATVVEVSSVRASLESPKSVMLHAALNTCVGQLRKLFWKRPAAKMYFKRAVTQSHARFHALLVRALALALVERGTQTYMFAAEPPAHLSWATSRAVVFAAFALVDYAARAAVDMAMHLLAPRDGKPVRRDLFAAMRVRMRADVFASPDGLDVQRRFVSSSTGFLAAALALLWRYIPPLAPARALAALLLMAIGFSARPLAGVLRRAGWASPPKKVLLKTKGIADVTRVSFPPDKPAAK